MIEDKKSTIDRINDYLDNIKAVYWLMAMLITGVIYTERLITTLKDNTDRINRLETRVTLLDRNYAMLHAEVFAYLDWYRNHECQLLSTERQDPNNPGSSYAEAQYQEVCIKRTPFTRVEENIGR